LRVSYELKEKKGNLFTGSSIGPGGDREVTPKITFKILGRCGKKLQLLKKGGSESIKSGVKKTGGEVETLSGVMTVPWRGGQNAYWEGLRSRQ